MSASPANLKCCIPNGIPIIVMQNRTPQKMCDRKIQIPPIKNQMMFIREKKQPKNKCLCTISLPKGHNANIPSLTVWSPKGIPMIVINNPVDINSVNNSVGDCPQELLDKHIYTFIAAG